MMLAAKSSKRSIAQVYLLGMILLATLPVIIVTYLSFAKQQSHFEQQLGAQREDFLSLRKTLLQAEVDRVSHFLDFEKSRLDQRMRQTLRSSVMNSYALIESIDAQRTVNTADSRQHSLDLIDTPLSSLAEHSQLDLLLITADGRVLHNDVFDQKLPSLLNTQAAGGRYIVREMIDMGRRQGEGFISFDYADGESAGEKRRYKVFLKYYPALDLMLAGSLPLNDAIQQLQQRVLQHLSSLNIANDNAVPYITDANGVLLLSYRQPEMVGKNITAATDRISGQNFFAQLKQAASIFGGGFITLNGVLRTPESPQIMFHFVRNYADWQWIIGASLSLDAMDVQLQAGRDGFKQSMLTVVMLAAAIIVAAVLCCLIVARRLSVKSQLGFSRLGSYFKDKNDRLEETDAAVLPYSEFEELGKKAAQAIEERRYFADAWQSSEQRFNRALQYSGQFMLDSNKSQGHWLVDAALFSGLGYQNAEGLQRRPESFYTLIHPKDREALTTALEHSSKPLRVDFRMQAADGQYRWLGIWGGSIAFDDSGRSLRVLGLIRDISEQKALQVELLSLKVKADSATHLQSQFLASMQRQVQAPLAHIIEDARLLLEARPQTMEQQQYLTAIRDSGNAVYALFEDILLMSVIDSDALSLSATDCEVDTLVAAVLDCVNWKAEQKGLKLIVNNSAIGARIHIDQLRLKQILVNLLSHAVRCTRQGSIQFVIDPARGGGLVFFVKDTGVGMSTGQVEQLTQLSLQPGAHVETSTGAGLGLAIAYRLATLLAATLSVSSQPASGNCFTLRLPQQLDVTTAEKQAG